MSQLSEHYLVKIFVEVLKFFSVSQSFFHERIVKSIAGTEYHLKEKLSVTQRMLKCPVWLSLFLSKVIIVNNLLLSLTLKDFLKLAHPNFFKWKFLDQVWNDSIKVHLIIYG
jgi:hypothetical protein